MGESIAEGTVSQVAEAAGRRRSSGTSRSWRSPRTRWTPRSRRPTAGTLVEMQVEEGETVEVGTIVAVHRHGGGRGGGGAAKRGERRSREGEAGAGEQEAGAGAARRAADAAGEAEPATSGGRSARRGRRRRQGAAGERRGAAAAPLDPGGPQDRRGARRRPGGGGGHGPGRSRDEAGHHGLHRGRGGLPSAKEAARPRAARDRSRAGECAGGRHDGRGRALEPVLRRSAAPGVPGPGGRPGGAHGPDPAAHRRPHGAGEARGAARPLLHRDRLHPDRPDPARQQEEVGGAGHQGQLHRLRGVGRGQGAPGVPHGERHGIGREPDLPRQHQPRDRGGPEPRADRAGDPGRRRADARGHLEARSSTWPAGRADRKLKPDEIQGATFSITNPGIFGTYVGHADHPGGDRRDPRARAASRSGRS